nr:hypothetical protein Iba_chr12aCG8300 [Ipomoea batatas]
MTDRMTSPRRNNSISLLFDRHLPSKISKLEMRSYQFLYSLFPYPQDHNRTIFAGLPSLKEWKEKYVYVGYTEDVTFLGFTNALSTHINPYTVADSYPELDAYVGLLCTGGPFDHRLYCDSCRLHQLS